MTRKVTKKTKDATQLTHEEFVLRAIEHLRVKPFKGIHTVISGFNDAFRAYFDEDPIATVQKLAAQKKIQLRPAKRGVMIYLPDEKLGAPPASGTEVLKKLGLQPKKQ